MHLRELSLLNYRNYKKLGLKFDSNLIFFSGRNAQGKTNILESIFLLSTGRSHRTPRDRELILQGERESKVSAMIEKKEGQSLVEIFLNHKENKKININGMTAERLGQLMGHINSVLFSPEDLKLVKGSPGERRRFMDIEISQIKPKYFYSLQQYNRILSHRNNLLKDINERASLKKTLYIWDEQLSKIGAYIINERNKFTLNISKIARIIHREISSNNETLEVFYNPSIEMDLSYEDKIIDNYLEILKLNQEEDIKRGNTGKGCHRDDLIINIDNMDVRTYGSQGQQRTTVLSLKLSEIEMMYKETEEYPILLLDDVLSELDKYRQEQLLSYFDKVQTFMTLTDFPDSLGGIANKFEMYKISKGNATKI